MISSIKIKEWVPGSYPIPFFQTWCCSHSSVTPSADATDIWSELSSAGLPPKMYACVRDNLVLNNVGVDCIHYLFHDAECRDFIAREYPPDVLMAYDCLIPTAFKADLWRYCVLYKYGGVYLDAKLGGVRPPTAGTTFDSSVEGAEPPTAGVLNEPAQASRGDGGDGGDGPLREIVERFFGGGPPPNGGTTFDNPVEGAEPPTAGVLNEPAQASGGGDGGGDGGGAGGGAGGGDGGGGGGGVFVLERDAVGLWPSGRHGIHNAFMITKPKNPILLECIFRIVSAAKNGWYARGGLDDDSSAGWMTRPLCVTGPGLLGAVWRGGPAGVSALGLDSYATMAPYFRFFFEGDGVIGYHNDDASYVKIFKVYDGYQDEYRHMTSHRNCVPHYTVLWSRGLVWGGVRPPTPQLRSITRAYPEHIQSITRA